MVKLSKSFNLWPKQFLYGKAKCASGATTNSGIFKNCSHMRNA